MSQPVAQRHDVPQRSPDQRRDALALANRVRAQRAKLKAQIKQGGVSIVSVIGDPPAYLATAKVAELLRALPGYGPTKVARLLERCRVSPRTTFTGLSKRQRGDLIGALEE